MNNPIIPIFYVNPSSEIRNEKNKNRERSKFNNKTNKNKTFSETLKEYMKDPEDKEEMKKIRVK